MRIEFEDRGQDFLWWEINDDTGLVTDCGPFQAWLWADGNRHVELESLEVGEVPFCYESASDAAEKMGQSLKYEIVAIN